MTSVYTFGQDSYGELGHGDTQERYEPKLVEDLEGLEVVQVVAGNEHTAVLCANGDVLSCGYNESGQCGHGHNQRVQNLTLITALKDCHVTQIHSSNGCEHMACLTADGELYTMGYNQRGQLGHGHSQNTSSPTVVGSLFGKTVVDVACSYYHSVCVTDKDEIFCFGRNDYGQLGNDGNGEVDRCKPTRVQALFGRQVISVACGQHHTMFSLVGGGLYACGKNDYGQLGIECNDAKRVPTLVSAPLGNAIVTQIACGYHHTLALDSTGKLYGFGRNDYGQLGLGHRNSSSKPEWVQGMLAEPQGGRNELGGVPAPDDLHVRQITCGCYHSLVLVKTNCVYAFGRNNHGQLGTGETEDQVFPKMIPHLKGMEVTQVAAGFYHSVCLVGSMSMALSSVCRNRTLQGDLSKLLNNASRSDVTFLVEGKPIFAHKCIIMARCEPLEVMLGGPMRESGEAEIVIPDHSYPVFLALLEFLYTDVVKGCLEPDEMDQDMNFAINLLTLADQYLVEALKRKCEIAIQKNITVDNVSFVYKTADDRQARTLRKKCFNFILYNLGAVFGTSSFPELPQQLLSEVLLAASKRGVQLDANAAV